MKAFFTSNYQRLDKLLYVEIFTSVKIFFGFFTESYNLWKVFYVASILGIPNGCAVHLMNLSGCCCAG